jgi:hypothetical protein
VCCLAGSTTLVLQRLVLAGFQLAPPGASQPLFWPQGLVAGAGDALNATDVRFVVQDVQLFSQYLKFFSAQKTLHWTVSRAATAKQPCVLQHDAAAAAADS